MKSIDTDDAPTVPPTASNGEGFETSTKASLAASKAGNRWLDQWAVARGEPLRALVDMIQAALDEFELRDLDEKRPDGRKRRRKSEDAERFAAMVEAVIVELAYAVLMPPTSGCLAVMLKHGDGRGTRYDNPAFGKGLSPLLGKLEAVDVLALRLGASGVSATTIAPSTWFASMVEGFGVSLKDFGRDPREEVIILNRNTPTLSWGNVRASRASSEANNGGPERVTHRERIDYKDTPVSRTYRDEIRRINAHLAAANIDFVTDGARSGVADAANVDPFKRTLRRYFVLGDGESGEAPRFDRMGRLFGEAFWLNLASERRGGIRIDGEPVANLDFSGMFLRLVYAAAGEESPQGDPYAILGLEAAERSFVKFAVNCFLCDRGERRVWPPDKRHGAPDGLTPGAVRKAVLEAHPVLRGVVGTGAGMHLMMTESRIMVAVLLRLTDVGVTALPLHDGLLVAASKAETARRTMQDVSEAVVGVRLPVACKAV